MRLTEKETEILKEAINIISDENRWTKRNYAVDSNGIPVSPSDPNACKFCAIGALNFALGKLGGNLESFTRITVEFYERHGVLISVTNDNLGREKIISMLNALIKEQKLK